ncbi:MAG: hypothetical protein IPL52_12235 [Flavobacteriales bacterium]|nr:hypothetical protein [Flavobacteriales bacterium]
MARVACATGAAERIGTDGFIHRNDRHTMNSNEQFDELARRKLAERDFPFQEAHWLDAQRAIAAQHKGRRGGALWMVGGAAAVIIAAWLLWPASEVPVMAEGHGAGAAGPVEAGVTGNTMEETTASRSEVVNAPIAEVESTTIERTVSNERPQQRPVRDRATTTANERAVSNSPAVDQRMANTTDAGRPAPQIANTHHSGTMTASPVNDVTDDLKIDPLQPGPDAVTTDASAVTPASDPANSAANVHDSMRYTAVPGRNCEWCLRDQSVVQVTLPAPGLRGAVNVPVKSDTVPVTMSSTGNTLPVDPTPMVPTAMAAPVDPPLAEAVQPNETANASPDPAPIAPPLITPRSPWELSALIGAFNSTSTYSGGNSAAWNVSPERTYGGGAELVRMGRNVGLGLGVHYGTYADRLRTPGESRSELSTSRSWFLDPVDTTILIVTGFDTATGFFTTQNVNVTINQLRMTLDSSYASVVIREARERINRTSYVEAVGLLDAHLVQGRWSLGVRGGPSIGLLTTHSGSIPSNGAEEITFNDLSMQRFVLGWTARAYVRYRFNAAWSLGIEPAARGQFGDGFSQDGSTRRSSAVGGMISVSYRLP